MLARGGWQREGGAGQCNYGRASCTSRPEVTPRPRCSCAPVGREPEAGHVVSSLQLAQTMTPSALVSLSARVHNKLVALVGRKATDHTCEIFSDLFFLFFFMRQEKGTTFAVQDIVNFVFLSHTGTITVLSSLHQSTLLIMDHLSYSSIAPWFYFIFISYFMDIYFASFYLI